MRSKFIIISFTTLLTGFGYGQQFSIIPQNAPNEYVKQLGNVYKKKGCDGTDPKYLKVIIRPSCYGANMRGGGIALNPQGDDVKMSLKIRNEGEVFDADISFPIKSVWPENYGQSCTWVTGGGEKVSCLIEGKSVNYKCSYNRAKWFLDDTLSCTREMDLAKQGELNKKISCLFFYNWSGTGYAAVKSYKKKIGTANCGLRDRFENFSNKIKVTSSKSIGRIDKYGKRGEIIVELNGANIKKRTVSRDLTTGEYLVSGKPSLVNTLFYQNDSKGLPRELTHKIEKSLNEFEQCLHIKPSFLGMNRFCGSYYSPLMLFFDANRPNFSGRSSFPLYTDAAVVHWVEKGAPGYLLALDRDGDGRISSAKELFGDGNGFDNGFESLKDHDHNADYRIDQKDKVYSQLLLWRDINGDGESSKNELTPLKKKGVSAISLYYQKAHIEFSHRAEVREKGTFSFIQNGKKKDGIVWDVWFSPAR